MTCTHHDTTLEVEWSKDVINRPIGLISLAAGAKLQPDYSEVLSTYVEVTQ